MEGESLDKRTQKLCEICNKNPNKYCCPRCEQLYCSLECYKSEKHMECAESFYRDCVNEELTSHHTDEESRRKMMEILKKIQEGSIDEQENIEEILRENEDSDDEEEIDLNDRLQGLNLDNADEIWNALTEDERNEFEALISQGDVGSIIPQWEPWWMYRREAKFVEDVEMDKDKETEALAKCPKLKDVPKLSSLTTIQPSPIIGFNIINVLASYAFIIRYFNGECNPIEASIYLLNICDNLNQNAIFEDLSTAIESVAQKCLQSNLIETDDISLKIMKQDTFKILQGPSKNFKSYYCKASLSHLHDILTQARMTKNPSKSPSNQNTFSRKFPEHKSEHLPQLDLSKVKKVVKKIEYYLSYVDNCDLNVE